MKRSLHSLSGVYSVLFAAMPVALAWTEEKPHIAVTPAEVVTSTTVAFDDQGAYKRTTQRVKISVRLTPPPGMQLASVGPVTVTKAVTDVGDILIPRSGDDGSETFHDFERERGRYDIDFDLGSPSATATEITTLTGTFQATALGSDAKLSRFDPISEWSGKSVVIEGLGLEATLTHTASGITLQGPRELFDALQKSRFLTAGGVELKSSGWSGSSSNDDYKRTWNVVLPADGAVEITFLAGAQSVPVEINLERLPLKGKAESGKTVIKSTPVPKTKPTPKDGSKGIAPAETPEPKPNF